MQQIFIELFNYNDAWRQVSEEERQGYRQGVLGAIAAQVADGIEVIGWGFNDQDVDRRAPYDFYCVYKTPSPEAQRQFEREIAAAGWYGYFDQVNVSGSVSTPAALLTSLVNLEVPAP